MSVTEWPPDPERPAQWWNAFWSRDGQNFGPPSDRVLEAAQVFFARKQQPVSAVDIAAGDGRYTIPLAQIGYSVAAVEYTAAGVRRVRDNAARAGVKVELVQGDFLELASSPRGYDLVLSSGLLEEVPCEMHTRVLEGYAHWTAPGGRNIVKYCLAIEGRGQLVADGLVPEFYARLGWQIALVRENAVMKASRAGLILRTGTVIADRL